MRRSGASDWTGLVAALVLSAAFLLGGAHVVRAQDLGHRIPGSVGLDAGQLLKPGLFAANRTLYYTASRFRDRHGDRAPIPGFRVDIVSDLIGAALVLHLEPLHTYHRSERSATRFTGSEGGPAPESAKC